MKSIFRSTPPSRRHRHTQPETQQGEQQPFFTGSNQAGVQRMPQPFFQPKLTVGQPGDPYEREADAVADAVVNQQHTAKVSAGGGAVQRMPITPVNSGSLQRAATPEEEKMPATNDGRMAEDKKIQEKPESGGRETGDGGRIQKMDAPKEEEKPVQKAEMPKEEEKPVQKMDAPKEEEKPVQKAEAQEEEMPAQAKEEATVQRMEAPKEEEKPVQKAEAPKEEEKPVQKAAEEEEPVQAKAQPGSSPAPANLGIRLSQRNGMGQPLPAQVRGQMERSIGADFSGVRVHQDAESVEMNRDLHAQAFTHGQDIYFNAGKFNPEQTEGKRLLAHELTHVVQQRGGQNYPTGETNLKQPGNHEKNTVQRKQPANEGPVPKAHGGGDNPLDKTALSIIAIAANEKLSNEYRAQKIVRKIIKNYFPHKKKMVKDIIYEPNIAGLKTYRVGEGTLAKGIIAAGDTFITNTNEDFFARQVLRVEHELLHIEQYRENMIGKEKQDEREFLAHYATAMGVEYKGTGRLPLTVRYAIVNAAVGYWYCLPIEKRREYFGRLEALFFVYEILFDVGADRINIEAVGPIPRTCARPE